MLTDVKELKGSDLADYIKERQSRQVRGLGFTPKLAIVQTKDDPVIDTYVSLKKSYGADIGIEVDIYKINQLEAISIIKQLNRDHNVSAIIVQLPLENPENTDEIINTVDPQKDVDGLCDNSNFDPATPTAILWLLSGNNIELNGKKVAIVGKGRLVGASLYKMLDQSGVDVEVADKSTPDLKEFLHAKQIIITATGKPGLITTEMLPEGAVVVDAGLASENGKKKGDLDPNVYDRNDITVTPIRGGVGPLTVCALFENVIRAATS